MDKVRRYHPSFAEDLIAAPTYYDDISAKLGAAFRDAIRQKLQTITRNPELFARIRNEIRASTVERFPYKIRSDTVLMLGVYHAVSDQAGWFERSGA